MITRTFTHTFKVDLSVKRVGDEFIVTAERVDSDGGAFHTPSCGPLEIDFVQVEDIIDDPMLDAVMRDAIAEPVLDELTRSVPDVIAERVVAYLYGDGSEDVED